MRMIFYSLVVALTLGFLVLVLAVSALFARRDRNDERRAEEKRLRELAASQYLSRYHHRRACNCGLGVAGETSFVRLDVQCLAWTKRLERIAAEIRRWRIRQALREAAVKRNEPGVNPARGSLSIN